LTLNKELQLAVFGLVQLVLQKTQQQPPLALTATVTDRLGTIHLAKSLNKISLSKIKDEN